MTTHLRDDLRTVMWKEWKSLFRGRGSRLRAALSLFMPLGVFAVYVPASSGEHWVQGVPSILASVALPLLAAILVIPDSFAGERERHTLPTLLASRLSDRSILLGKTLFVVALAWGLALLTLLLGLVTVNLAHLDAAPLIYSPRVLLIDVTLSLAVAVLGATTGVLISLRSTTVQEAQQLMTAVLFVPPTLLGPVLLLVRRARPEWSPRKLLADTSPELIYLVVLGVLIAVDGLLLRAASRRFQREELISS